MVRWRSVAARCSWRSRRGAARSLRAGARALPGSIARGSGRSLEWENFVSVVGIWHYNWAFTKKTLRTKVSAASLNGFAKADNLSS